MENLIEHVALQRHVPRRLIASIVRNGIAEHNELLAESMKRIVETRHRKISGLHNNFSVHPAGFSFDYAEVKPTFYVGEIYGRAIERAIRSLVNLQIKKDVSLDVIFLEPDSTYTKVVQAWLCKDMKLASFSTNECLGLLDLTFSECVIMFKGFVLRDYETTSDGVSVLDMAQTTLKQLNVVSANPLAGGNMTATT